MIRTLVPNWYLRGSLRKSTCWS